MYRFVLVLPSGEPGEPGILATLVRDWDVGDTFTVGSALRRYRITGIRLNEGADPLLRDVDAVWTVEPVSDADASVRAGGDTVGLGRPTAQARSYAGRAPAAQESAT
jgi:hypothetical protein